MKPRSVELSERAFAAMLSAIELYNKPRFSYRLESFCILALNAWELLFKAKWLRDHDNKESCLYKWKEVKGVKGGKMRRIDRSRSGAQKTHAISFLLKKFDEERKIEHAIRENLEALEEFRNFSTHYYFKKADEIALRLQEIALANVRNFAALAQDWFSMNFSGVDTFLLPLALINAPRKYAVPTSQEERRFLEFLKACAHVEDSPDNRFSVSMQVDVNFVKQKSGPALPVCITNDPSAQKVVLSDEQLLEKYPLTYDMLVEELKGRYEDFVQNKEFHLYKRRIEQNPNLCILRKLDPRSKINQGKKFYAKSVIEEFDKYYSKKPKGGLK